MFSKKLDIIELQDIQELIENEVAESKTLEYKRDLHIETGDERKEFLADISSFANADGGYIIYGISENGDTKLPDDICGIPIKNEDELIRKIENMLRDSIAPRIPDIDYKAIRLNSEKGILIIYISPSFLSPHRVTYKSHDKFYTRNSKGKYSMDVNELRQAFTFSESLYKQIESYKLDNLSSLVANRYGYLEDRLPIFNLSFFPLSAFRSRNLFSIDQIKRSIDKVNMTAFGLTHTPQITIDGIMINGKYMRSNKMYDKSALAKCKTNGIVEQSTTDFFNPAFGEDKIKLIYCAGLIEKTITVVKSVLQYYQELNVPTPIIMSCAIMNGDGFTIPAQLFMDIYGTIDREALLIPDVLIDDLSIEPVVLLRPVFNAIWNSCGYPYCPAYDERGNYVGARGW